MVMLAIIILGAAFLVWLEAPIYAIKRFNFANDKEKSEAEDSYRKTIGQAIGAIAVIATFAWTFIKDSDTIEQAHKQFAAQNDQFKEQQDQARRQFANQQFIAAATLLKDDSVGPRVARIYGLRQVAADQKDYLSPAIYAALGFIKRPGSKQPAYSKDTGWPSVHADTQSAIELVAKLDSDRTVKINFDEAYLVRADFSIEPNTNAFKGGSFQGATLYGSNFSGIELTGAKFNGSYMTDWEAYGDRWDWVKANAQEYANTRLHYVMNFTEAQLVEAGFDNTNVGGGIFDGACLSEAKFWKSDLSRASFKGASLGKTASCEPKGGKAHFFEATLIDANFDGVDVGEVSFEGANLTRTHFRKALNVDHAKFGGACGDGTEFPSSVQIRLAKCGGS
jgi:uncharacterized protein YjbI with pentapeptide repeats